MKVSLPLITKASTSSFHGGGQAEEEKEEGREEGRMTRRLFRDGLIRKGGGGGVLEEEEGCRLCVNGKEAERGRMRK